MPAGFSFALLTTNDRQGSDFRAKSTFLLYFLGAQIKIDIKQHRR